MISILSLESSWPDLIESELKIFSLNFNQQFTVKTSWRVKTLVATELDLFQ